METLDRPGIRTRVARGLARASPVRRVFARAGLAPTAESLRADTLRFLWTVKYKAGKTFPGLARQKVVLVNQKKERCGIYQFGKNTCEALAVSGKFRFEMVECANGEEFAREMRRAMPSVVIVNYHPFMDWLTPALLETVLPPRIPVAGLIHEMFDVAKAPPWDLFIDLDPSAGARPGFAKVGRYVPDYVNRFPVPAVPTIGSFGFGDNKGFERLVERVQADFDRALIRLRLPFNDSIDADGRMALGIAARCRALLRKPGIELEISHDFLDQAGVLDFLAQNSMNAFLYDDSRGRGVSSAVDQALAVDRPIAVTRTEMFRHIRDIRPSICVEDSSLKEILERGTAGLRPYREDWSRASLVKQYEAIVEGLLR